MKQDGLVFVCDQCKKPFFMPLPAAAVMQKCTEKICSPKCAEKYLPKDTPLKIIGP